MNMYKVLTHLAFNIGESGSSLWVQKHSKPGSEDEKETLRLRFCRSDGLSWWLPQWRCTVPTRGRQRDLEGDGGEVGGGQQRHVEDLEASVQPPLQPAVQPEVHSQEQSQSQTQQKRYRNRQKNGFMEFQI